MCGCHSARLLELLAELYYRQELKFLHKCSIVGDGGGPLIHFQHPLASLTIFARERLKFTRIMAL